MTCGTCKEFKTDDYAQMKKHWKDTGCDWRRDVWVKVVAARRRGSSGRRLLSAAYPHLYKRTPMTEEAKERLRELGKKRIRTTKRAVDQAAQGQKKKDRRRLKRRRRAV